MRPGSEGHDTIRIPPLSNGSTGQASEFSGFPQRLWKTTESGQFRSTWWSVGGQHVAISEELYQEEVLGSAFATQKMKSFIQQLNICGFNKVQPDLQRSASMPEIPAEEAAASSHSRVWQLPCTQDYRIIE